MLTDACDFLKVLLFIRENTATLVKIETYTTYTTSKELKMSRGP